MTTTRMTITRTRKITINDDHNNYNDTMMMTTTKKNYEQLIRLLRQLRFFLHT